MQPSPPLPLSLSPYLLVFLIPLLISALLTPAAMKLSHRWGILAKPGGRRRHSGLMPKLGGLPLFIAFLVGAGLAWYFFPPAGDDALRLRGVLLGALVLLAGGLLDDRWDLPPRWLFLIQFVGVGAAMFHEVFIERFTDPFGQLWVIESWVLIFIVTSFWMVGMINTVNFLDGLDGLAAGVGTIAALLFAWHSYELGQTTAAAFPLALAGALVGFLFFNFSPARIFLGSAGAYFLGYGLATLSILSPAKIATALLVLAVPILDVAWQIIVRLRRRRSPFEGDRGHLHFRLADSGWPTPLIVLAYYGVATAFGLAAIFATGLVKLLLLIILAATVLLLFIRLAAQPKEKE